MMMTLQKCLFCAALCGASVLMAPQSSFAQQTTENAPASNFRPTTRSLYVEMTVVVLLIGGAVYAVCRSGRRV